MTSPHRRALLVDDHPAVRQVLALLLEQSAIRVVAEADNVKDALGNLAAQEVDIAVVDLSFEHGKGFELITALRERSIPVLVYSMHEDRAHIDHSLACGARAYVSKREDSDILIHGIEEVINGRSYLSPRIENVSKGPASPGSSLPRCSEREVQILRLLGQGKGCSEIAETLTLSVRTVESYCARINDKLELSGMRELRQFAIRHFHPIDSLPPSEEQ